MSFEIRARVLALVALGAAACGGGTMTTPDAGEAPDSGVIADVCTDDAPCALALGARSTEYIAPAGDTDRYTFDVPAAGSILQVVVTNDADFSPIRLEVALFAPSGAAIETKSWSGNGKQRLDLQLVAPAAGTYQLLVRDSGNDAADRRNPYFVTASTFAEADGNEPNDVVAEATALVANVPTNGTIGAQGDGDWFAIDVGAGQLVDLTLSSTAKGSSPVTFRYELFAPDGTTRIAEGIEDPRSTEPLRDVRAVGNSAGRYLLRISDERDDGADQMRIYILTVALVAEPDANDLAAPNDTSAAATTLTAGRAVTGYVASRSDADYYAIRVNAASPEAPALITVTASLDPASDVDLAFDVLDTNGLQKICEDDDSCRSFRFVPNNGAPERPRTLATSHVVRTPGRYFVVVRDNQDDDWDVGTSYSLTVDTPAEPDAFEAYETSRDGARVIRSATSTASAVLQFPWVEGYLSYADDVDWFRFDLPGPMGAPAGQNGDWLLELSIQKPGPTP
ncbi:pre-peptidase C-terminal domain-containing protein, partial [Myxococcota bacterium]|nr:pre-peptidase C-terminal domain-containing protein [Myxococcota bacterium]